MKFTAIGGVEIKVDATPAGEDGAEVSIRVRDSGIGIDDEAIERLFNPFSQADVSTTREYGGTGLGLTICRQLAELMGGEVGATSRLGAGSTFWLRLPFPLATGESGDDAGDVETPADVGAALRDLRLEVLVAEDNRVNQAVIKALLGRVGLQVDIASDGVQAVAAAEAKSYDIILMDMQMPRMDGIEATQHIRQHTDWRAEVPIVAVTANAMAGERERLLTLGLDDYVTKPLEERDLFACILRQMDRKARPRETAGARA